MVVVGDEVQTLTITVTNSFPAVPTTTPPTTGPTTTTPPTVAPTTTNVPPTQPPLPNTGAPILAQLWWAAVLLATGFVLVILGRTRLRRSGQHS